MHKITLTLRYHTPFQAQHGVQVNHYSTETMSMTETAKSIAPDTLYGNRNTCGRIHVVACCVEFLGRRNPGNWRGLVDVAGSVRRAAVIWRS